MIVFILVVVVVVDMDDLEVIRFVAMVVITNSAYHAFSGKKSTFLASPFTNKRLPPLHCRYLAVFSEQN